MKIKKRKMVVIADTGSTCNVMGLKEYDKLNPKTKASERQCINTCITLNKLEIVGKFKADFEANGKCIPDIVYVSKIGQTELLSCLLSQKLNLVKLASHSVNHTDRVQATGIAESYLAQHPESVSPVA